MILRYTQSISAIITLYDHLCTIDSEVQYIWSKPWMSSKILYIATRYAGDLFISFQWYTTFQSQHSQSVCDATFYIIPWVFSLSLYFCQVTLCYRLSALYNNNKQFICTICCLFVFEIVGTTATAIYLRQQHSTVIVKNIKGIYECLKLTNTSMRHNMPLYWTTIIIFESILFSLTIWKFMSDLRHAPINRRFSLIRLIVGDSLMYYGLALAIYLIVGLLWSFKPKLNPMVHACFVPAFSVTIACRLILCLSECHDRDINRRRDVWSSDIQITSSRRNDPLDGPTIS
ncbi:hypothetical protein BDQ17DRAFT_419858 [Cyathus striatus]|nr:hypothetical protein BDQ17DRAFT_419858 [Cyathus striatus]